MIKAILLDMDGTLIDTEILYEIYLIEAARRIGFDLEPEFVPSIRGLNAREYREACIQHIGNEEEGARWVKLCLDLFNEHLYTKGIPVKPGVPELLEYLKNVPLPKYLVSSSNLSEIHRKWDLSGLEFSFDGMLAGDQIMHGKPHPEPYLAAASRAGCKPGECLVIEDSVVGVTSACEAGCRVIAIPDIDMLSKELQTRCVKVIKSAYEAPAVIEEVVRGKR